MPLVVMFRRSFFPVTAPISICQRVERRNSSAFNETFRLALPREEKKAQKK